VFDGLLAFAFALRTWQIIIRRRSHDANGEGAEIMEGTDLDLVGLDGVADAIDEGNARTMADFCVLEAKSADLIHHRPSVNVAMSIPTS
jgi:hypothetical protein